MDRRHRHALIGAALVLAATPAVLAVPRVVVAVECPGGAAEEEALREVVRLELTPDVEIVAVDEHAPWTLRIAGSRADRSAVVGLRAPDGSTVTLDLADLPGGALGHRIVALAAAELVRAETARPAVATGPPPDVDPALPRSAPRSPRRVPVHTDHAPWLGAAATLRSFFPARQADDRTEGLTLFGLRASGSILASPGAVLRLRAELGVEAGLEPGRLGDVSMAAVVAGLVPEVEASYGAGVVGLGIRIELAHAWARGDTEDWNVRARTGTALLLFSGAQMSVRHRLGRRLALEATIAGGAALRGMTLVVDGRDAFRASGGWVMLAAGAALRP